MSDEVLGAAVREVLGGNQALVLYVFILLNFAAGVLNALKDGKFTVAELGGIMKKVLPYLGGYTILGAAGNATGGTLGSIIQWLAAIAGTAPFLVGTVKETTALTGVKLPEGANKLIVGP